ncbi:MAG: DUF1580 domain-containing protein [Pirellulales bacterium]|nr:DUF1580 domain-containing protein [Pirellulales bacterium]
MQILNEELVRLNEAAELFPANRGRKIGLSTLYRYAHKGVHGVRLETALCGGHRATSREAVRRFCERLSQAQAGQAVAHA